ncbi:MAG: nodulation protein NfeD, partial [Bacteroidales bacterium]
MKRFFLLLLILLPLTARGTETCRVFVLTIDSEIHAKSARTLEKALQEAEDWNAQVFLMRLNTFGGALDAAEKMRTALLESPFTTVAFIDHQAASAGALISLACDLIYMSPGSTIGAATVVNQKGEPMPEKYQSYMRSLMRATAEKTGRDTKLAEQMVNGEKIVSLTTQEAIEAGFSQGRADGISETLDLLGYSDCEIQEYKETWL